MWDIEFHSKPLRLETVQCEEILTIHADSHRTLTKKLRFKQANDDVVQEKRIS